MKTNKTIYPIIEFPTKKVAEQFDRQMKLNGWNVIETTPTINIKEVKKLKFHFKS